MRHRLNASKDTVHWGFYDPRTKPVLRVRPGDSVDIETVSGQGGVFGPVDEELMYRETPQLREIEKIRDKGPGPHMLTGPIEIRGAEPGDVLAVFLREIRPSTSFGFNLILPDSGTLPEDYPYVRVKVIRYDRGRRYALFAPNIRIPLAPFFGHHGVAPPLLTGRITSRLPGVHGGNLDNKELGEGSVIYLPVHLEGAMYSVGDGHAVQGDGEVNVTALEASMHANVRFEVRRDVKLTWPLGETQRHVICMGYHSDLDEAAKIALRNMISYLEGSYGLNSDDAYALCSLAVDFHVTQLVNGLRGVHALLPKSIFENHSGTQNRARKTARRTGR